MGLIITSDKITAPISSLDNFCAVERYNDKKALREMKLR